MATRLSEAVAMRLGRSGADLVAPSGAIDRGLPCTIRGRTYLCRNGIYVKKHGQGEWQPCTKFSLRIEESILNNDRQIAHRLLLQLDGKTANITVSHRELLDGSLPHERATAAGIEHGQNNATVNADLNPMRHCEKQPPRGGVRAAILRVALAPK